MIKHAQRLKATDDDDPEHDNSGGILGMAGDIMDFTDDQLDESDEIPDKKDSLSNMQALGIKKIPSVTKETQFNQFKLPRKKMGSNLQDGTLTENSSITGGLNPEVIKPSMSQSKLGYSSLEAQDGPLLSPQTIKRSANSKTMIVGFDNESTFLHSSSGIPDPYLLHTISAPEPGMDRLRHHEEEIPSPVLQPTLSVGSTKPTSGKPPTHGGHLHTFFQVDTLVKIRLEGAHADANERFHIVGNRPELGNWLPTPQNELKYFRDECWLATIKLQITATGKDYIKEIKDIEYKYVKVKALGGDPQANCQSRPSPTLSAPLEASIPPKDRNLEWEKVPNRKVSTYDLLQIGRLNIEDSWSKRRVVIRFIEENEENTEKYSLHIIGDIPHLGQLNLNFKKMKLVVSKVFGKPQTVWETSCFLDYNIDHFYYTYVRFYRKKKKVFFDRNRQRECILSQAISEEKGKETTCDLYYSGNTFFKIDLRIDTELKINEFTTGILFGPYPQLSQDYRRIFERDVKRIVNLMTGDELMQSLVDGVHLHKKSATHNLDYVSLEYDLEVPYAKRIERLKFICQRIHHMVLRNEKIYVCEMFGWQKISEVLHHLTSYHLKSSSTNNTIRESPH